MAIYSGDKLFFNHSATRLQLQRRKSSRKSLGSLASGVLLERFVQGQINGLTCLLLDTLKSVYGGMVPGMDFERIQMRDLRRGPTNGLNCFELLDWTRQ
jgi:hypothetical protein